MELMLKTTYPCLIKTNNEYVELEENDTLTIQDERMLFVYPKTGVQIPFYINLKSLKENAFYSILEISNKKILLLEQGECLQVVQKENLNFAGKTCQIEISKQSVTFETENKKITYTCPHNCKNYEVFKSKNFACVKFKNDLYVYSMNKSKLLHFGGDELSVENDIISLTKKYHDSECREKKSIYKIDEDISTEKEDIVSINTSKSTAELLPYKLLEGIKAKDISFVMNCLSANLKSKVNDEQIKEFFGNVSAFLPLSTTEFITITNRQKNFVQFKIVDDEIDDILIDGL